ncbi:MAG: hypothetical protein OXG13_12865 [Gemmatimonadaceae bacterium]|nr:hypothetical protein [Gemmatimonadaceae bacterium]
MRTTPANPWHKASFDDFLHRRLPELLAARLGVSSYRAERADEHACRIILGGHSGGADFEIEYDGLPAPDGEGVFRVAEAGPSLPPPRTIPGGERDPSGGVELVVLPVADRDDLAEARIACLGDRLSTFIEARLGQVPEHTPLDGSLLRTLAPLGDWFQAFLASSGERLDDTNWLSRAGHLRRLLVPGRREVFTPAHFGRTCPFETPEGPNIGRVLTISRGAEIRGRRLVIVDGGPAAGLGLSGACVPFLEHDDGNRVLMGANMMRQWLAPAEREPALVQTGLEPRAADFWCGRNLLTALVSWDGDAFDDALLVSRSGARMLACPDPLEAGDKLSNRHGIKGVVSRVAPDEEMPRLPDGTPVELVLSFSGIPSRWVMGLVREAALGHVARLGGESAVVPPFEAPSDEQLRDLLPVSGLRADGMTTLTLGGTPLRRPSTAGWVYWGCTMHRARPKLRAAVHPDDRGQRLGVMEVRALAEAGAPAVIRELTNTCSTRRGDAGSLAGRAAAGPVEPASTPSPAFAALAAGLAQAGIRAEAGPRGVAFRLEPYRGPTLSLAAGVPHPWLPGETLSEVCAAEEAAGYPDVAAASARLARLLKDGAPEPLAATARADLAAAVSALYDGLAPAPEPGRDENVLFSGRAVIVPGSDLPADRIGLPEEMAWSLFGPLAARESGDSGAVRQRSTKAGAALSAVMENHWIILNHAPSVSPTAMLAFRPLPAPGHAIRLCPLACGLLDVDFDGDQAAVFLPLTETAQAESRDRLSIAAHLARDPDLVDDLLPGMDALFGLACLGRSAAGRQRIAEAAGRQPELEGGLLTRAAAGKLLREILAAEGEQAALGAAAELMRLGFEAARAEGASIGPFIGHTLNLPALPKEDDAPQWQACFEEAQAAVAGFRDYDDDDLGAAALLSHSGARATVHQLTTLVGPGGLVRDIEGRLLGVRRSWRQGLTAREVLARVVGARRGLFRVLSEFESLGGERSAAGAEGFGVLARARRVERPGIVFARAAMRGEVDPLEDEYSRLLVGLSGP